MKSAQNMEGIVTTKLQYYSGLHLFAFYLLQFLLRMHSFFKLGPFCTTFCHLQRNLAPKRTKNYCYGKKAGSRLHLKLSTPVPQHWTFSAYAGIQLRDPARYISAEHDAAF